MGARDPAALADVSKRYAGTKVALWARQAQADLELNRGVAALYTNRDDALFALAGLLAAMAFVVVNHALLAVMLQLGRGHSFRESGLFSASGFGIELVLALLGVAIGAFAGFNPWLLPALIAPLALGHRSLSTVALLRESEERFRTMFASAPSAIMLFDLDGHILGTNRSAQTLFGYSEAEMLGQLPTAFRHPDDIEEGDVIIEAHIDVMHTARTNLRMKNSSRFGQHSSDECSPICATVAQQFFA